jgi:mRNA-degrading endonuclease toxin of MazEF toxin-antitoxin module
MKKLTCLLALSLLAVSVKAQQPILFKIKYLPKHVYKMNMDMNMSMEMTMPTDGTKTPAKTFKQTATNTVQTMVTTGAPLADHTFPLKMQITGMATKAKMNGNEIKIPDTKNVMVGQLITGKCDADGKLHVDQVKAMDSKDAIKKGIADMINKMQGQIKFPERSLAVGESFTQDTPINMPAAGMNMDMNAKTTYKLTAVKGNLAYFDTKLTMTLGLDDAKKGSTMTGGGAGTGKMVYNIAENNFNSMTNNMDMRYSMNMSGKPMAVKMKIASVVKNDISR